MIFSVQFPSKEDIRSLRSTSKDLYSVATRKSTKRYVFEPVVAVFQYGLQFLVDICRHFMFGPQTRSGLSARTREEKRFDKRKSGMWQALINLSKRQLARPWGSPAAVSNQHDVGHHALSRYVLSYFGAVLGEFASQFSAYGCLPFGECYGVDYAKHHVVGLTSSFTITR
jgi:hypothetical protein